MATEEEVREARQQELMSEMLGTPAAVTTPDALSAEATATSEPTTAVVAPVVPAPEPQTPVEAAPETPESAAGVAAPLPDADPGEGEATEVDMSALLQEIDRLAGVRLGVDQNTPQQVTAPQAAPVAPEVVTPTLPQVPQQIPAGTAANLDPSRPLHLPTVIPFVSQDDHDEAITSPEGFNRVLTRVVSEVLQRSTLAAQSLATQTAVHVFSMLDMRKTFYGANPDLLPVANWMALTTNEIQAQHPDWTAEKLLNEAAKTLRKKMGAMAKVQGGASGNPVTGGSVPVAGQPPVPNTPSFVRRGARAPSAPGTGQSTLTRQQQLMAEMLEP